MIEKLFKCVIINLSSPAFLLDVLDRSGIGVVLPLFRALRRIINSFKTHRVACTCYVSEK